MSPDKSDVKIKVEQIENTLKEILNWIKLGNKPLLREILIRELDSEEKKKVYELTDGIRSQYEIEALTKISRRMVGYHWQKWYGLGIVVTSDRRKGRMQKIISLDEMGMSIASATGKQDEVLKTEFQAKDLKDVLNDQRIFPDNLQLQNFAFTILPQPSRELQNVTREELIDVIMTTFEQSDRIRQKLFLQALERRALERQSSEFSKFFEAWEKQIGQ